MIWYFFANFKNWHKGSCRSGLFIRSSKKLSIFGFSALKFSFSENHRDLKNCTCLFTFVEMKFEIRFFGFYLKTLKWAKLVLRWTVYFYIFFFKSKNPLPPCCRLWNFFKMKNALTHYSPRNFLSPIFLKICINILQDVPINEHTFVFSFWNKSLLKRYRNFYTFDFFNSAVLSFKFFYFYFLLLKAWD